MLKDDHQTMLEGTLSPECIYKVLTCTYFYAKNAFFYVENF